MRNEKEVKFIPFGLGDGTCLVCGEKCEASEYGYYGNRAARFYCREHLKEHYASGGVNHSDFSKKELRQRG